MRICLIGGIYGTDGGYLKVTPETTLEAGFRAAGHEVFPLSHYEARDFDQFDVVHVHHLSYGAVRLASDGGRTPFVFTMHDASRMSGAAVSAAVKFATQYVMSRADGVVGLTEMEVEFLKRHHSLNGALTAAIPNGIHEARFPFVRRNRAGAGEPWRLLFCGQLIALKGVDLLLRAMASTRVDCSLTLVYQTPLLETRLKALAQELGLARRVNFLGKLGPDGLAEQYQTHDVLMLPSEREALPSVITEAMMSGLPFIATRVGGIVEQAGGFGCLLERRTVDGLVAGIEEITTQYSEFAAKGAAMSAYARGKFSVGAMTSRHLALYSELVGKRARRRRSFFAAADVVVRAAVERWGGSGRQVAVSTAGGV
ncbi:MAG: glycosyltransferase family 4 protein [Acidobacteria bacterium]|nr:glycosyltransferase family 4 protein [Acidobacteriota bacterium]